MAVPVSATTVFTTQPASSVQVATSRYVQGGLTDVYPNRLGWWDGVTFTTSPTDLKFILEARYNTRPDLLAYDVYGKATLMWVVLQYNAIVDINEEFITGVQIILPSKSRLFSSILISQTGGNPVPS